MKIYNQYIVTKRFKELGFCGSLNLPFGTKCFTSDQAICCDKGIICAVTSQNAFDYFTQNDDGRGIKRRKLIQSIFDALSRTKQDLDSYNRKWDKVWNNSICLKYKQKEYEDHWLWNYDFYNAEIIDLQYIAKLVNAKEVA